MNKISEEQLELLYDMVVEESKRDIDKYSFYCGWLAGIGTIKTFLMKSTPQAIPIMEEALGIVISKMEEE